MTDQLQKTDTLFDRVVAILEQARSHVVKSVNSNTIIAYWLIGLEIVEEVQSGEERAEYGKGFSVADLKNFRQSYQVFQPRLIRHPLGSESEFRSQLLSTKDVTHLGFRSDLKWSRLHCRAYMEKRGK